jgi:hypothetical protein
MKWDLSSGWTQKLACIFKGLKKQWNVFKSIWSLEQQTKYAMALSPRPKHFIVAFCAVKLCRAEMWGSLLWCVLLNIHKATRRIPKFWPAIWTQRTFWTTQASLMINPSASWLIVLHPYWYHVVSWTSSVSWCALNKWHCFHVSCCCASVLWFLWAVLTICHFHSWNNIVNCTISHTTRRMFPTCLCPHCQREPVWHADVFLMKT